MRREDSNDAAREQSYRRMQEVSTAQMVSVRACEGASPRARCRECGIMAIGFDWQLS